MTATETQVLQYTKILCEALVQNYINYSIRMHQRSLDTHKDEGGIRYHHEQIAKLKDGISDYDFVVESGKKYHKIIMIANGARSVHAFVDKKTGSVLKSASWKSPAKGERFNLMNDESREECYKRASWCGNYLYLR